MNTNNKKNLCLLFLATFVLSAALVACSPNHGSTISSTSSTNISSNEQNESLAQSVSTTSSVGASVGASSSLSASVGASSSVAPLPLPTFVDSGLSYTESTDSIENPGRGFYAYFSKTPTDKNFSEALISTADFNKILDGEKNSQKQALQYAFVKIGLNAYSANMGGTDTDLTESTLLSLRKTFDNLRASKISATLRFTYDPDGDTYQKGDCEPKTIEQILKHVEQLADVINDYKDCIYSVDAGMFGPWGEMHSTSYSDVYLSGTALEKVNDSLFKLIDKWLTSTNGEINISVRRPRHYVIWYNKKYNASYAFSDIESIPERDYSSKIGLYNDGYLNGTNDDGTYQDRAKEISWLEKRPFSVFGGETNSLKAGYTDGSCICKEGFLTHTAYLNYQYNQQVVVENSEQTAWKQQTYGTGMTSGIDSVYAGKTYFDYISNHLGYRLVLRKSELYDTVKKGQSLVLKGNVENVGFGNLTTTKRVYILLVGQGRTEYILTDFDAQKTFTSGTHSYEITVTVPSSFSNGSYTAYMKIASPFDLTKEEVNRQVRFANNDANIFSQELGANLLGEFKVIA